MLSIQTNIASLIAQNNIRANSAFQNNTITQLSSGYRINSSADDAAGLAVANKYRGDTAELTQGVLNANNSIASLQIVDGGVSNISTIVDRLRTLATESASTTFTGNRTTLNNEYQGLLTEINRQASNVNLNSGGLYNSNLITYVGGGSSQNGAAAAQSNAQVTVNLSGSSNAVDTTGLGIGTTGVEGGGTELKTVGGTAATIRLDDAAVKFLAAGSQAFTFQVSNSLGQNQQVVATATDNTVAQTGLAGSQVIDQLNSTLQQYGITASISATDGTLQFGGTTAFSVAAGAGTGGAVARTADVAINSANFNVDSFTGAGAAVWSTFAGGHTETIVFQNASGSSYTSNLDSTNTSTIDTTLTQLNTDLKGSGITAVKNTAGTTIDFQSASTFGVQETVSAAGTGNLLGGVGTLNVAKANTAASSTGGALAALGLLSTAVTNLGLIAGQIGGGINKLNYAVNLAQSQITNYSAAQSGIRDADVAAQAANLTKAQVLQQASLAALAQANSAPQAVLSLLKG